MCYNNTAAGCSTVGSARLLGSRGRRFKSCHPDHFLCFRTGLGLRSESCHPDHKNTNKNPKLALDFLNTTSNASAIYLLSSVFRGSNFHSIKYQINISHSLH